MDVDLIDYMGSDLSVVNAARVSFNKESNWEYDDNGFSYDLSEKDQKLIKYLAKEGHYSPFGHAFASFRVKAPIFVRAQLVKHEYLRMNEVSRRYVDTEPEFYTPDVWRGRAEDKKQGSEGEVSTNPTVVDGYNTYDPEDYQFLAVKLYKKMLEEGICPEQARMVLPQSTYTEWIWSGSLDAFANMYKLRTGPHAQQETKEIAEMIGKEMKELFPYSWEALCGAT